MSFWDNESRLVQHLCHSFVISDDTGYADRIFLETEDLIDESDQGYHLNQRNITGMGSFSLFHTQSITKMELDKSVIDITRDAKFHSLHHERVIKLVNQGITDSGSSLQFHKKNVSKSLITNSLLSQQISTTSSPDIAFSQFAKFDASTSNDRRTLNVTIIFGKSLVQLKVIARFNIRVYELIGLSLFLYHEQNLGEKLCGLVDDYKLYIADANGEIDRDFPPLCESDYFNKFGFSHLGLVHAESSAPLVSHVQDIQSKDCVTIVYKLGDYPNEEKMITMPRPSNEMQMIEVLSLAIKKKGLTPSEEYILSESIECCPISHDRYLKEFPLKNFWLLKQDRYQDFDEVSRNNKEYYDSNIHQSYGHFEACWLNKKGEPWAQILLSDTLISFKPLILDHKQSQRSKFKKNLTLPKTELLNTNSVQMCDVMTRSNSIQGRKAFFIMATKGSEKKVYEFESDVQNVHKILSIMQNICPNLIKD